MADLCFCSFAKIPDKPMTQATAVAVHFYSLLMTWGQAGSAEHKQYRLPYWGLGLEGLCLCMGFCAFGLSLALEILSAEWKSYLRITVETDYMSFVIHFIKTIQGT